MVSKKGKGNKGKQPAPKKSKPVLPEPTTSGSSGDELDDPVNMANVQCLEALVRKWGGSLPAAMGATVGTHSRNANTSFQVQVLANLAALEEDGGEMSIMGAAALGTTIGNQGAAPRLGETSTDSSQMVVYKGPQSADGKLSGQHTPWLHWPWGPVGGGNPPLMALSAFPSVQHQGGQVQASAPSTLGPQQGSAVGPYDQPPGWSWGAGQAQPQLGWGSAPWGQQLSGGWAGFNFSGGFGSTFDFLGPGSVLFGDIAMPLGEHLTVATRDKILRGDYVDVFPLLFWDLEKKDKDELDEHLKECIK